MSTDLGELRFRLRTPGVWVHHLDYSRAEPSGYVRDSAPFEAADAMDMQALQIAAQAAEIARLQGERTELARWKSTHAPRLEALEGLLHAAQHEAHAGREAIATLASERAANAMLTNEADARRVAAERWCHCVAHGFPFRGPQWIARTPSGRYVLGDTANEAIDAAIAAREST